MRRTPLVLRCSRDARPSWRRCAKERSVMQGSPHAYILYREGQQRIAMND